MRHIVDDVNNKYFTREELTAALDNAEQREDKIEIELFTWALAGNNPQISLWPPGFYYPFSYDFSDGNQGRVFMHGLTRRQAARTLVQRFASIGLTILEARDFDSKRTYKLPGKIVIEPL